MDSVARFNRNRMRFWLDAALSVAFVLTLVPRITGMRAHEWLGIGMSAGAMIHLALHWRWIRAVIGRYLKPLPRRTRVNAVLDTLLFVGSALLLLTGVLMSPSYSSQPRWWAKTAHSVAWMPFAGLVILHIALHWRWILGVAGLRVSGACSRRACPVGSGAVGTRAGVGRSIGLLSRRQFLVLGGGAMATLLWGAAYAVRRRAADASEEGPACPFGQVNDPYPGRCHRYRDADGNGICDYSELGAVQRIPVTAGVLEDDALDMPVATPTAELLPLTPETQATLQNQEQPELSAPLSTPILVPTTTPTAEEPASGAPAVGPVACPFGQVSDPFPGRCRRYTDGNGNGYCDFSEPGSGVRG